MTDTWIQLDNTREMSAKCLLILSVEMIFIFDGFANGQINKLARMADHAYSIQSTLCFHRLATYVPF